MQFGNSRFTPACLRLRAFLSRLRKPAAREIVRVGSPRQSPVVLTPRGPSEEGDTDLKLNREANGCPPRHGVHTEVAPGTSSRAECRRTLYGHDEFSGLRQRGHDCARCRGAKQSSRRPRPAIGRRDSQKPTRGRNVKQSPWAVRKRRKPFCDPLWRYSEATFFGDRLCSRHLSTVSRIRSAVIATNWRHNVYANGCNTVLGATAAPEAKRRGARGATPQILPQVSPSRFSFRCSFGFCFQF